MGSGNTVIWDDNWSLSFPICKREWTFHEDQTGPCVFQAEQKSGRFRTKSADGEPFSTLTFFQNISKEAQQIITALLIKVNRAFFLLPMFPSPWHLSLSYPGTGAQGSSWHSCWGQRRWEQRWRAKSEIQWFLQGSRLERVGRGKLINFVSYNQMVLVAEQQQNGKNWINLPSVNWF